jgi:hypothetical protein
MGRIPRWPRPRRLAVPMKFSGPRDEQGAREFKVVSVKPQRQPRPRRLKLLGPQASSLTGRLSQGYLMDRDTAAASAAAAGRPPRSGRRLPVRRRASTGDADSESESDVRVTGPWRAWGVLSIT